jgi:transcriptional regulator with XRE-family HTH domain
MEYDNRDKSAKSPAADGAADRLKRAARPLDAEVGKLIRHHRKRAKMTMQYLASRLGITYQQVQKYETGVNRIAAGRLMEVAEILEVPLSNFFGERAAAQEPDAMTSSAKGAAVLTLQGRQLVEAFLRIKDPARRQRVLSYICSLAESDTI